MGQRVHHLVVGCSDFRLVSETAALIARDYGQADLVAIPGAELSLVDEDSQRVMIRWLETLYHLHGFIHIHLVGHTDCGAYKVTYPELRKDNAREPEYHNQNLQTAADIIKKSKLLQYLTIHRHLYHTLEKRMLWVPVESRLSQPTPAVPSV